MKINEIISHKKIGEAATAGATSAGNIATVVSPHIAIGKDRFNKSYHGSPGKSGTKAPKLPKIVQKPRFFGRKYGFWTPQAEIYPAKVAVFDLEQFWGPTFLETQTTQY